MSSQFSSNRTNIYKQFPRDWEIMKVEELAQVYGGTTPRTTKKEYWNGNILWATPTDITNLSGKFLEDTVQKINELAVKDFSLKILPPNTLLLTTRATIGYCAVTKKPTTINQGITAFIPKKEKDFDPMFYAYFFEYIRNKLKALGSGSTFREVSRSTLKKLLVPVPPLWEQRRITKVLSSVDDAIQRVDEAIAKTERLKQGLMQKLLTKGLNVLSIYHDEIISAIKEAREHLSTGERNLAHHLADSLREIFRKYDVDVELIKETGERPDIVVHKRGVNDYNLLAIEIKIDPPMAKVRHDIEKLERLMLKGYLYRSALFIAYNTRLKMEDVSSLSKKVNIILVRPDGSLDEKFVEDNKEFQEIKGIGKIPKTWKILKLEEIAARERNSFVDGPFGSNLKRNEFVNHGIPVIQLHNISEGRFIADDLKYITEDKFNELRRHEARPGDLIITKLGDPIAAACIVPDIFPKYMIVADCVRLRVNKELCNPIFLQYVINSIKVRKQAIARAKGSTRKRINLSEIKKLLIPLPSLTEQNKIADILSTVDIKLKLDRKRKEKLLRIKRGLMNDLLTGRKRLKVAV